MSSGRKHPKYENITSRWGGMKIRESFAGQIDEWLQAFPKEEHAFLLELLMQFYYYSEEKVKHKVIELYDAFRKQYEGDINDVVYTKIIKEQGVACSDILFTNFWMQNNSMYSQAENNIVGLLESGQVPKELVIVDDYSGTGNTFIKTVKRMIDVNESVKKTNLYFLTMHVTQRSIQAIENYAEDNGLNIACISLDYSEQTFKQNYIYNEIYAERKKKHYMDICQRKEIEKYVLGYEEVASLVSFYYNTPNNTLGLFWQDLADFAALFPRKKKQRTTLAEMQKKAKDRKFKEESPVVFGIEDGKMKVMLIYCLGHTKNFYIENFINTFGLTALQADEILKDIIEQGYMTNEEGKLQPTAKLKSHVFASRIKTGQSRFQEAQKPTNKYQAHEEYIPRNFI